MSEQSPEFDETGDENAPNWRRKLEADAKAGREAQAKLAELQEQAEEAKTAQRELALLKAGVNLESPTGRMFAKAYDGPLEAEAISGAWGEIAGSVANTVPPAVQQAYTQMSHAVSGGVPTGGQTPDFNGQLDSIPLIKDGQYNPDYVNQVLAVSREAAAAQGRPFEVSGGQVTWQQGAPGPGPVTTETA